MKLGRYILDELIGEGGFGQVWRGTLTGEMGFAKTVAIKVLHPELSRDQERSQSLINEALIGARLKHRNIVEVHEFTRIDDRLLMVMEMVDGETLSDLLARNPQGLDPAKARSIIQQIADGLAYAHQLRDADGQPLNLVHRDLKPANVMISPDGTVKICDFGIALSSLAERQTATGMLRGTPNYMSPEQVRGLPITAATDTWALGAIAFELLTGRRLVAGADPRSVVLQIPVVVADAAAAEVEAKAPDLSRVISGCLQQRADQRPSASALFAAFTTGDFEATTLDGFAAPSSDTTMSLGTVPQPSPSADTHVQPMSGHAPGLDEARRAVRPAAIGLIAIGVLNWLALVGTVIAAPLLGISHTLLVTLVPVSMAMSFMVIFSGFRMLHLRNRRLAQIACLVVMLGTPGNLIGFPIGIWAFTVLARREVMAAFAQVDADDPAASGVGRALPWLALGAVVFFAMVGFLALNNMRDDLGLTDPSAAAEEHASPERAEDKVAPASGGTLRVGWQGSWGHFEPIQLALTVSSVALSMTMERLVRISPTGQVEPWLLDQMEFSEDGKTLTLSLRPDLIFHAHPCLKDGAARAPTATDLVASIEAAHFWLNPLDVRGLKEFRAGTAERITGLRITGDREVTVDIDQRAPFATYSLNGVVLFPAESADGCTIPPPGTGPFRFTGGPEGAKLVMKRASTYWGPPAHLDTIELIAGSDDVEALSRLGSGDLDMLVLYRSFDSGVLANPQAKTPSLAPRFSQLDVTVAPWVRTSKETVTASIMFVAGIENDWSTPGVRRALALALDRTAITAIYPGAIDPSGRFLESRLLGADPGIKGFVHDPVAARQMLAEAGHPGGRGLSTLRLGVSPQRREVGALIVKQAEAVGLPINVHPLSGSNLARVFREKSLDAVLLEANNPLIGDDPYTMLMLEFGGFHGGGMGPRQAALIEQIRWETDRSRRAELYGEFETLLLEEPPYIPIGFRSLGSASQIVLVRPNVQGAVDPVTGRAAGYDWQEWWPKLSLSTD